MGKSACYVCLAAGSLFVIAGFGQDPVGPEFEVASVRASTVDPMRMANSGEIRGNRLYGDRAEYVYQTLRQLIVAAYGVLPFQVVGPDWITVDHFDVFCKMPAGSRKEDAPLMLQSLLKDRFKLVIHRESREQSVSALVLAKGGPKLEEVSAEVTPDANEVEPGRAAAGPKDGGSKVASLTVGTVGYRLSLDQADCVFHIEGNGMSMADLAAHLAQVNLGDGRPVVDMTGLKGTYRVVLDIPYAAMPGMVCPTGANGPGANDHVPLPAETAGDAGSSRVMHSLKSLGLDLENRRGPVERLTVDRVERKPTEN